MTKILNFINDEMTEGSEQQFMENFNPATGQVYSRVVNSSGQDVEVAVCAAQEASALWADTPFTERAKYLRLLAKGIAARKEEFAKAECIDTGKPLALCLKLDIPRAIQNFEFFADAIEEHHGESFGTGDSQLNQTYYSPLGVVACISPWNLPLYLLTWKIAPALVTGNTVVAKPSEITPMSAYLLAQVANEVGLPKGVLNIIHGEGPRIGPSLVQHKFVRAVSFTGSTATGRIIASQAAQSFKKVSLEMGGKNANIIFADCNFEKALRGTVRSSFLNQGQICLCGSRIFIEKGIFDKFRDELVGLTRELRQTSPLSAECDQGAVVSQAHMEKVLVHIENAKKEGGQILTGGQRNVLIGENQGGYFIQPTLIEGLSYQCKINQEEVFGPVATLIPFESESELLKMVNGTTYGLSASVWTQNLDRANRVSQKIEAGVVWINSWMARDLRTPFGGMKESGYGREGGQYGLRFFSEIKNVCIDLENGG